MAENVTNFGIKYWNEEDRPREKLLKKGRRVLTKAELIAIIIGSGSRQNSAVDVARRVLNAIDNNLLTLAKMEVHELMHFDGIGEAKAVSIIAALELGRRHSTSEENNTTIITSSKSANDLLRPLIAELPHEEFWVIYLNNANKVLDLQQLSKGGTTGTIVDVRLTLKRALLLGAVGVILAHNHPSGSLKPSAADIQLTKKLEQAGKSLDIKVLDHLIITEKSYFSFADEHLL